MKICMVVGHVWATKKEESLSGLKLMVVKELENAKETYVAADMAGAGVGERVLVVSGSTARVAVGGNERPVDAAIVGIIDTIEVDREAQELAKQAKKSDKK